ncbi:hypothetical protein [Rhizobium leguminosarum]|uniref:hypothetical protein n=1 Tax=Rhizobium leguminosarum TaxID=384 RepID=UPI001C98BBC5|nr:hypothetical protein [Rhizobium leguminosarum]
MRTDLLSLFTSFLQTAFSQGDFVPPLLHETPFASESVFSDFAAYMASQLPHFNRHHIARMPRIRGKRNNSYVNGNERIFCEKFSTQDQSFLPASPRAGAERR